MRILDISLMKCGRVEWQKAEAKRKDFNIVLIHQDTKCFYLQALQGHSGRNPIDPSLQDNVVIQSEFFHHIYHIGCTFNLHSIINNGLIPGGQNSSKRQTVFFLPIDPMDKSNKDPDDIDLNVPRHAQYLHNAWRKHLDAVYWVDVNLAIRKRIDILPDSIECNHPSRNTSSLLYPESC